MCDELRREHQLLGTTDKTPYISSDSESIFDTSSLNMNESSDLNSNQITFPNPNNYRVFNNVLYKKYEIIKTAFNVSIQL